MVGPFPDDPYPVYDALRETAPVYRSELGLWFATTYADCVAVLRDPRFGQGAGARRLRDDDRFDESPAFKTLAHMLPFIDPPDHTRLRKLITRAFTPRAVERMRAYLDTLVDLLLDDVRRNGGGDLMVGVAHHIPVGVICEMLGAPHDHDRELVEWSDALVGAVHPMVDDAELVHANDGARAFREFVSALIDARRAEPRDDLITALVHAESDGDLLTGDELVSTVILFIGAGIENTKHFIGSCFHALLEDRHLAMSVRADQSLVAPFCEEVLRLEPPVQIAVPRLALEEVTLGGVRVPAGEQICVVVPAANRDPSIYACPDELDLQRVAPANLSLATGPHLCAGAALARLEAHVAVARFVERFAGARLVAPGPSYRSEGRPSLRGLAALPVTV
jgi:cytochrome P450